MTFAEDHAGPLCEALDCRRLADWAYIGEAGDLFICEFHGGKEDVDGWTRINDRRRGVTVRWLDDYRATRGVGPRERLDLYCERKAAEVDEGTWAQLQADLGDAHSEQEDWT